MLCLKCCFQEKQTETLSRIEKEKQKAQNFQTHTFSYNWMDGWMDGWMRFYFFFLTLLQSCQDDVWMKMKAVEPRLRLERFPPPAGLEPGTAGLVRQRLTH